MRKTKWYKVPGYLLEVTKYTGKVRDLFTKKIIHPYVNTQKCREYRIINAKTNRGKFKTKGVHQLVARTFIGQCPKGYEVNHKDLNKGNNSYKNLEYKTHKKNMQHALKRKGNWSICPNPIMGEKHYKSKLKDKDIPKIFAMHSKGYFHKVIAKKYGVSRSLIGFVLSKHIWKHIPLEKAS